MYNLNNILNIGEIVMFLKQKYLFALFFLIFSMFNDELIVKVSDRVYV